ncbi:unnamed protein product [Mesocestoides corti]|uniref:Transposase n=1 Tax=Mesocestoides corti TaxID=53468 RepID=A0A0R3U3T5_MESCO|nr:unnamed protein product [Mesocestoides corti]
MTCRDALSSRRRINTTDVADTRGWATARALFDAEFVDAAAWCHIGQSVMAPDISHTAASSYPPLSSPHPPHGFKVEQRDCKRFLSRAFGVAQTCTNQA